MVDNVVVTSTLIFQPFCARWVGGWHSRSGLVSQDWLVMEGWGGFSLLPSVQRISVEWLGGVLSQCHWQNIPEGLCTHCRRHIEDKSKNYGHFPNQLQIQGISTISAFLRCNWKPSKESNSWDRAFFLLPHILIEISLVVQIRFFAWWWC